MNRNTADRVQDFALGVGAMSFTYMLFDELFVLGAVANGLAWLIYVQARITKQIDVRRPKRVFVRNSRSHHKK